MLDRSETPWYPDARLFRQGKPGDWGSVMQRIACELQAFAYPTSAPETGSFNMTVRPLQALIRLARLNALRATVPLHPDELEERKKLESGLVLLLAEPRLKAMFDSLQLSVSKIAEAELELRREESSEIGSIVGRWKSYDTACVSAIVDLREYFNGAGPDRDAGKNAERRVPIST